MSFLEKGCVPPSRKLALLGAAALWAPALVAAPMPAQADPVAQSITTRRVFLEPLVPVGGMPTMAENRELLAALEAYLQKGDPEAVDPLLGFLGRYPDSPWGASLWMNLGAEFRRDGRLTQAEQAWQTAWERARKATDPSGVTVAALSGASLADLWSRVGDWEPLTGLLRELESRGVSGQAAVLLANARQQAEAAAEDPGAVGRCGMAGLVHLAEALGHDQEARKLLDLTEAGRQAPNMADVQAVGGACGLPLAGIHLGSTIPVPALLHWRTGHFATLVQRDGDRYLAKNYPSGEDTWLSGEVVRQEAGGCALVPAKGVGKNEMATEAELRKARGTGTTAGPKPGIPNSPPCSPAMPDPVRPPTSPDQSGPSCSGMPVYQIQAAGCTLKIQDKPLWYDPPVGPKVAFHLSFNQMETLQAQTFTYWNVGPKWTSDWFAYVQDTPASPGQNVTIFQRGGGTLTYSGYNSTTGAFAANADIPDLLVRTSATSYVRTLPDGSQEVYAMPNGALSPRWIFLTAIVDPAGNTLSFTYDSSSRLTKVTDALGQVTTLTYGLASDPLKVTRITDPFGRAAVLTYVSAPAYGTYWSPYDQLASITDMGGLTSSFTYYEYGGTGVTPVTNVARSALAADSALAATGSLSSSSAPDCRDALPASGRLTKAQALAGSANKVQAIALASSVPAPDPALVDFITSMTTSYGTSTFQFGDNGTDRWVQATDPMGQTERAEYHNNSSVPGSEAVAPSGFYNGYLNYRNTFYWDKLAYPTGAGDWTKARIWHWLHTPDGYTSSTLESSKKPLESRVWQSYPGQSNTYVQGSTNVPSSLARVLDGGTTQRTLYQYDALGLPTQVTDPAGRVTTNTYAANGVDLLTVANTTGGTTAVLATYTYNNQHKPTSITDAAGQTTAMAYNALGQIASVTDPLNEVTTFTYNPPSGGYLAQITGAQPSAVTTFGYDALGRVNCVTDPQGRTVTTQFDNLDRPTVIAYPDQSSENRFYTNLDLTATRDRAGNWTLMAYDPLRRLIQVQDAGGRITKMGWCLCGSLEQLTDPLGNITNWWRDLQGRVIGKMLNDGTQTNYAYDSAGRLIQRVDPSGQITSYTYCADNNLQQVAYPNARIATSTVAYTYDPAFNRLSSMTDGFGVTFYTYNPITSTPILGAGRLATVTSPFPNSTIAYTYDPLGRVAARGINGVTETRSFDSLGRTYQVSNPLGTFTYGYLGGTSQLSSISLPNGQTTQFSYYAASQDFRLSGISNQRQDSSVISAFTYAYNPIGTIASWTKQADANLPTVATFTYDPTNQLLGTVLADSNGNLLHQYGYGYDLGGNRTSEQVDNTTSTSNFNGTNELTTSGTTTTASPSPQLMRQPAKRRNSPSGKTSRPVPALSEPAP